MLLRFENPHALWFLLAVCAIGGFIFWLGLRKGGFSWRRFTIFILGFSACVVGFSRPQAGHYSTVQRGTRGDLYIAMDISNSMRSQDINPSRLDFATAFTLRVIDQIPGIRVAVFPFAADGYLQLPLSSDIDAAKDLIASLNPTVTTDQGTCFDASLTTLLEAIQKQNTLSNDAPAPARVLLISDGESHQPLSRAILKKFASSSIAIDTLGVGTENGGTIPMEGRLGFGNEVLRDSSGAPVRTKLHVKPLREMAEATGGVYYGPRFDEAVPLAAALRRAAEFGKLQTSFKLEKEYYPFCFLIALLLFALEFFAGRWHYYIRASIFLAFASSISVHGEEQRHSDAYDAYNKGVEFSAQGRVSEAAEFFLEASGSRDENLRKRALYNLGNSLVKMQDPVQAISAYQRAYDSHSSSSSEEKELNRLISQNLVFASRMKMEQQQQQQQNEGDEGEGNTDKTPPDPGKAKQFTAQSFSEAQKKKMFDMVSSEDQQVLQKLQKGRNKKTSSDAGGNPW